MELNFLVNYILLELRIFDNISFSKYRVLEIRYLQQKLLVVTVSVCLACVAAVDVPTSSLACKSLIDASTATVLHIIISSFLYAGV